MLLLKVKGLIVGGIIRAGKEVNAKVIGSHMATSTEIEVVLTLQLLKDTGN